MKSSGLWAKNLMHDIGKNKRSLSNGQKWWNIIKKQTYSMWANIFVTCNFYLYISYKLQILKNYYEVSFEPIFMKFSTLDRKFSAVCLFGHSFLISSFQNK